MCVTCLFEEYDLSLLSTKHEALRTNYNTKQHNINTPYNHNQTWQTIKKCLFNNLDLLRCYDKKDMARNYELWDMALESLVGKD
jgi:hypothetical protein